MSSPDRLSSVRSESVGPKEGEVSDDACSGNLTAVSVIDWSASLLLASRTGDIVGVASSVGIAAVSNSVTSVSNRTYRNRQRGKRN